MKKIFLILMAALLLTGCSYSPKKVLLTKEEAIKYAKDKFGKVTFKDIESKTDDQIVYTFVDKKYGFEYEVISSAVQFCLDGSCSDFYFNSTTSTFVKKYYDYIVSSLVDEVSKIENQYKVTIKNNDGWDSILQYYNFEDCYSRAAFFSVYDNDKETMYDVATQLAKSVKKIDNRNIFEKCSIWTRNNERNSNGVYARIDSVLLK